MPITAKEPRYNLSRILHVILKEGIPDGVDNIYQECILLGQEKLDKNVVYKNVERRKKWPLLLNQP